MRRTCPANLDFPPPLAQYLEIVAVQHSAADQVTLVGELVVVQRLALAVLVAEVDCFAAATLAHCIDLARENSFVGSKAFEAGC